MISFDNFISSSVGAQNNVPVLSCFETAEIISFRLWPKSNAPYPLQKSMMSWLSASQMWLPFDFFTKNGYGSKYRTGLLTPDGITFFAYWNSFFERDNDTSKNLSLLFVNNH